MLSILLSTLFGGSALVTRAVTPRMQLGAAPTRAVFAHELLGRSELDETKLSFGCELCGGVDGCMCRGPAIVVESNSEVNRGFGCELCGGVDGCMCRGPAPAAFQAINDAFGA